MCRGVEYDAPIARYYERLAAVQARGSQVSQQVLRDILREVRTATPTPTPTPTPTLGHHHTT